MIDLLRLRFREDGDQLLREVTQSASVPPAAPPPGGNPSGGDGGWDTSGGEPLLSSSANLAGDPAPVHFREIPLGALAPDLAIDCGSCAALGPSTLVSCLGEEPIVLRQGAYHFSAV